METNKVKFTQANDTPFMQDPLLNHVGLDGLTPDSDAILQGRFDIPPGVEQGAADFIHAVKMDEDLKQGGAIDPDINTEDHISYWKRARESTQSSMSGLHFGFYKATSFCSRLAHTVASFVRIPYCTGFSPWRMRGDLNVSVMKEEGNYRPDKQRTIHLLEGNFSQGAKVIFSRRMLDNARTYSQIPEEQYARKGGKSIDAVLHKVLVYDYLRLTRSAGVCFSSDLMNNYDRMCHSVGSLAMRSLGVPICAMRCLTSTLRGMRHHIRTAYGDSEAFYSGTEDDPLQGGGQGNPAAPPMWVAITIILVKILGMYSPGVHLSAPISAIAILFTAIMYVDDTDLFVIGTRPQEKVDVVLNRAKDLIEVWCQSIWATGGLLRPDKCYYYLIGFKWTGSKWSYLTREDFECRVAIKNQEGEEVVIKRHNPDVAEETLGVHVAVDGNLGKQKTKLTDATRTWTHKIVMSGLFRHEAVLALITTLSRTWQYPLQATTFSPQDCEDIMKPLYSEFLPKMGASQKIPLVFRYGPKSQMGLGLPHIYTMQGTAQLKALLDHIQKDTMVGKFLHIELEAANIELGSGEHIFSLDFDAVGSLLTDCWIKSVWKFCHENKMVVSGLYARPSIQRQHDYFLMERLIRNFPGIFSTSELQAINRCRLFLQVLTMADVSTGDGLEFSKKYFSGIRDSSRKSLFQWPMQRNPTRPEWRLWQRAMCVLAHGSIRMSRRLVTPLGPGIRSPQQDFRWFSSPSSKCVYHRNNRGWMRFKKSDRNRTALDRRCYIQDIAIEAPPNDMEPTSISHGPNGGMIWMEGSCPSLPVNSEHGDMHWFVSIANDISTESAALLRYTAFHAPEELICSKFTAGKWTIVSDGSFLPDFEMGSAAIKIEDDSGTPLLTTTVKTPGRSDDVNAYRAELTGIYIGCLIIKIFEQRCGCSSPSIIFGCDNESAVKYGLSATRFSPITAKHFDLLWEIQSFVLSSSSSIVPVHVRGHQSRLQCEQSQLARMNSEVDLMAKQFLSHCIQNPDISIKETLGGIHWSLIINGHVVVKNIDTAIQEQIHGSQLRAHLCTKYEWSQEMCDRIDWPSIARASSSDTTSDSLWKMKMASGFVPTGNRMLLYKKWKNDLCPRCRSCQETISHMLSCNEAGATIARMKRIREFKRWMESVQTDPDLVDTVINTLRSRRSGSFKDHAPVTASQSLRRACVEQDSLGRLSAFQGFLSRSWREAQKDYWDSLDTPYTRSHRRWMTTFLRQWVAFSKDLWEQRNFLLHHKNNFEKRNEEEREVNQKIQDQFSLGTTGLRDNNMHLIEDTNLSEMLSFNLKRKSEWVENVSVARKRFKIVDSSEMSRMRKFLREWQMGIRDNG